MTVPVLSAARQKANLLAAAAISLRELHGKSYEVRRRGVLFIPNVLGHHIDVEDLCDQPWGVVGECRNCGCLAKAPRAGTSIEGRATTTVCPAAPLQ